MAKSQGQQNQLSGAGNPNELSGTGTPNQLSGMGIPNQLTGMMPGGMGQMMQMAQMLKHPKDTAKGMSKEAAKKLLKKLGKMAAQKLKQAAIKAGEKLLMNPYVLAAIAIIIAVIVLILIIVAIVNQQNNGGAGGSFGPKQIITCASGDYAACILSDFNISVSGTLPSNGLQIIFGILANAASAPTYQKLLQCGGRSPIPVIITTSGGVSSSYGSITLNGFFTGGKTLGSQTQLLIHELGHQIYNHNCGRIQQLYDYSTLVSADSACYDSGYLITYALRSPFRACDVYPGNAVGINGKGESFAETLGDYVAYKSYAGYPGFLCSIHLGTAYKNTCPNTYDWAKNNAFGGVEF